MCKGEFPYRRKKSILALRREKKIVNFSILSVSDPIA